MQRIHFCIWVVLFLFALTPVIYAQEETPKNTKATRATKLVQEKAGRPDIAGDLMIEFGFNWMQDHPVGFGFNTIQSRTFNAYYLFEKKFGESAFSLHPGLGLATENYRFDKDYTIGWGIDSESQREVQFVSLDSLNPSADEFRRSLFNTNYFDIPIEIRWHMKKYDPKRSFKITLGGKFGLLFDSKTKIKYREFDETKITKQKERFELNPIRYGAYIKLGFGGFSGFYYYSISELFVKDKGPLNTTMYPMTFGLSLALF